MFGEFGRAVQTYAFLRWYLHFLYTQRIHKHMTDFAENRNRCFTYYEHCTWFYEFPVTVYTYAFLRGIWRHLLFTQNTYI